MNMASACCDICEQILAAVNSTILQTPCNGRFHEHCVKNWCETALECPGCSGREDDCRQRYENLEMVEFPSVCVKVELKEEEQTATAKPPTNGVAAETNTTELDNPSSEAMEALSKEFDELAIAQRMITERWDRVKQRFQEILKDSKNN